MLKIITATAKELLLLRRDRAGLLILFLMPAILVVVITLVQENVMELTGQKKTRVVFLDLDQGDLGQILRRQLAKGNLRIEAWDGKQKDMADIREAVQDGDYQVGIVMPQDSSLRFKQEAAQLLQQNNNGETGDKSAGPTLVQVFFDPLLMAGLRAGITAQLQMALATMAMQAKLEALDRVQQEALAALPAGQELLPLARLNLPELVKQPLLSLQENQDFLPSAGTVPHNPVQQNVPAWALFGMFFTAIPIAGALIQERNSGIWVRLRVLPVSPLVLFGGKALAYIVVCLCQFLLIALIGAYLFPYVGLPAFTISMHLPAVLLTVLCSGLAATGYGIFLGLACNSYEQASTVGATTVVTAAAIGGVMVPVYAMPPMMQRLSIISPLNWGLSAFHDLILRGDALPAILDDLGRLLLFFAVTTLLAWKLAGRRHSRF
ncbi:MAG: ABC transporter permease [Deltaproteobacteria bacterium]|nr:ABC transporter permease [Deltaproteobacteria bacterium]